MAGNSAPGFGAAPKASFFERCVTWLVVGSIGAVVVALMLPTVRRGGEGARRSQCRNNLRQIAQALHAYEGEYHALPPAFTMDSYGTRLHSWRTLILPYLNEKKLYDSIDLSKPWDDPVNAKALSEAPSVYRCPSMNSPPSDTAYLACAAANGCFRPVEPRRLSEIKDSLAETLLVIEVPADLAVHWASPSDADEQLIMSIGADSKTAHTGGMNAALCDGAVRFLSSKTPPEVWRALISIAGGDKPGDF